MPLQLGHGIRGRSYGGMYLKQKLLSYLAIYSWVLVQVFRLKEQILLHDMEDAIFVCERADVKYYMSCEQLSPTPPLPLHSLYTQAFNSSREPIKDQCSWEYFFH